MFGIITIISPVSKGEFFYVGVEPPAPQSSDLTDIAGGRIRVKKIY